MEVKFNVAAILKDKPKGTKLYDYLHNIDVEFNDVETTEIETSIWCTREKGGYNELFGYSKLGTLRGWLDGLQILLPSKEMRDWRKFVWKKGDVLISNDGKKEVFFNGFTDDTYALFKAKHGFEVLSNGNTIYIANEDGIATSDYTLEDKDVAQTYINTIEERLGGKLNRETLEVEKPKKKKPKKKPVFELGNLYVFNEEDEDGELTIIGKLIGKNEIEDTLTFGNQYEIGNEKFVADQAFDLRISVHEELRKATEGEAITFHEAYTIWEKSKKQSALKPFDKVLVRDSESDKWRANLFGYIDNDGYYHCVYANWAYCIPYIGNESLLGTTKDVEG